MTNTVKQKAVVGGIRWDWWGWRGGSGEGAMGWAGEIPMHHLTVSISAPSTARTYFRAFIARSFSSLPARRLVAVTIVINDDNYYKEVNFPIVGVITSLWALSQPSLSRIIGIPTSPILASFRICETTRLLAKMFFLVYWHTLTELHLVRIWSRVAKSLGNFFYCTLRNGIPPVCNRTRKRIAFRKYNSIFFKSIHDIIHADPALDRSSSSVVD